MADTETTQSTTEKAPQRQGRIRSFVRRHPTMTVIGAAAAGLLGGVEVAAGMLLGAGVLALVEPRSGTPAHEGGREILPRDLRERARAVMQAARGELHAKHEQEAAKPEQQAPLTQ